MHSITAWSSGIWYLVFRMGIGYQPGRGFSRGNAFIGWDSRVFRRTENQGVHFPLDGQPPPLCYGARVTLESVLSPARTPVPGAFDRAQTGGWPVGRVDAGGWRGCRSRSAGPLRHGILFRRLRRALRRL